MSLPHVSKIPRRNHQQPDNSSATSAFVLLLATRHLPSQLTFYGFNTLTVSYGAPASYILVIYLFMALVNCWFVWLIEKQKALDVRLQGLWGSVLQYSISSIMALLLLVAILVNFQ